MNMLISTLMILASLGAAPEQGDCAPLGLSGEALSSWAERDFPTGEEYDIALRGLVPCLDETDPYLRDHIGYTGMSALLRRGEARPELLDEVMELTLNVANGPDPEGVAQPFAILVISEFVRTDRLDPWMPDSLRKDLVFFASIKMRTNTDYRGFDDEEGWRHFVAHTADLMLQLILNDNVSNENVSFLLSSLKPQIAPSRHSYIHGEPSRLVRPVVYAARRGAEPPGGWAPWLESLADPSPMADWGEAFTSEEGLAVLHNTKAFALALYATAANVEDDWAKPLEEGALEVLKALP
ncbi:DUF2785 domain-containing protein [Parvularcula marina]|uniref:DUF2785 domain-containing protein n=2 Tax=Parvularcula marina TaxID=2292771 RepID=A0A371RF90_9PROT|nr:DUF2785 domain-containing protein [Parvularcula marina]